LTEEATQGPRRAPYAHPHRFGPSVRHVGVLVSVVAREIG